MISPEAVVVMCHRGVRCAIPVAQVEAVDPAPEGAALALWQGLPTVGDDARVRHLRVRTADGLRWVAATDVRQGRVRERIAVPDLLRRGELVPAHVVALARVEHAGATPDAYGHDEVLWLAECGRIGAEI